MFFSKSKRTLGPAHKGNFDRQQVFVRDRYSVSELRRFASEAAHLKLVAFLQDTLKLQRRHDLFLSNDIFVQVIYEDDYLKLRVGAKTDLARAKLLVHIQDHLDASHNSG
jgi:hypothetical protein